MNCVGPSPTTTDEFFGFIERCAIYYGGPNWVDRAVLGLISLLLIMSVVLLIWVLLRFFDER